MPGLPSLLCSRCALPWTSIHFIIPHWPLQGLLTLSRNRFLPFHLSKHQAGSLMHTLEFVRLIIAPHSAVQYAYKPWTSFVRDCELFTLAPTCTAGQPCSKPVSDSPWWLRSLNLLWRPVTYEYGSGVVPNKGDGWQNYADEGEVRPQLWPIIPGDPMSSPCLRALIARCCAAVY